MKNKIVGHEIHAVEPAPYVEEIYHSKVDDTQKYIIYPLLSFTVIYFGIKIVLGLIN